MHPIRRLLVLLPLVVAAPATLVSQAGRVYLVRHAEKVDNSRDPALSAAGMARAMALADTLRSAPLDAILVSQFQRTAMTAAPVAAAHGITPQVIAVAGGAAAYADTLATRILAMPAGQSVLVVGHSNTLAPLIARLRGPMLADLCDAEYARLFTLDLGPPTVLRESSYGSPDAPDAGTCVTTMSLARQPSRPDSGEPSPMPKPVTLRDLAGEWSGHNSVWLMPGTPARESETTASVALTAGGRYLTVRYTWVDEEKPQDGLLVVRLLDDLTAADMVWVDSWHQSAGFLTLAGETLGAAVRSTRGSYPAPEGPDWGWRIGITADAADRFRILMHNITPEGEEALAVEAVYTRK